MPVRIFTSDFHHQTLPTKKKAYKIRDDDFGVHFFFFFFFFFFYSSQTPVATGRIVGLSGGGAR